MNEIDWNVVRNALLSRRVEESLLELFAQGKLHGTVHTCIGQEFSGAVFTGLLGAEDSVFSNHRCHGHFLSVQGDTDGLIAELMGRSTGVCGGRGGSQHLCRNGFFSNGIQGGIVPVAAGQAMARKLRKGTGISLVFIGDGTLGEGVVYETLNIVAKWKLPLLIILENNGYSQSTQQTETLAGSIADRISAFGIRGFHGDTWHVPDLRAKAEQAVSYVRKQREPAFLQVDTYRLKAHSKGDDDRPREEIAKFEAIDPLNLLLNPSSPAFPKIAALDEEIRQEVRKAIANAEASGSQAPEPEPAAAAVPEWAEPNVSGERFVVALNKAFRELLGENHQVIFLGEDIRSPYGGAFKATKELSDLYPERVLNTPISEAALAGIGNGLAIEGFRPIVEIMFGDFLGLAFDQILNHAAKFEYMYNGRVRPKLVVRTPMGGRRGYGPTHSQSIEKHFLGIPGLRVLALNSFSEPGDVYRSLCRKDFGPSLVIENKILYGRFLQKELPQGFRRLASQEDFPVVWIRPETNESLAATLVGYGGMAEILLDAAERLFEEHDLLVQILCPTQIYPFQVAPFVPLIAEAPRLLVAEEGQGFASFSSELFAQLAECGAAQKLECKRIAARSHPIPSSSDLEKLALPSVDDVIRGVLELSSGGGIT